MLGRFASRPLYEIILTRVSPSSLVEVNYARNVASLHRPLRRRRYPVTGDRTFRTRGKYSPSLHDRGCSFSSLANERTRNRRGERTCCTRVPVRLIGARMDSSCKTGVCKERVWKIECRGVIDGVVGDTKISGNTYFEWTLSSSMSITLPKMKISRRNVSSNLKFFLKWYLKYLAVVYPVALLVLLLLGTTRTQYININLIINIIFLSLEIATTHYFHKYVVNYGNRFLLMYRSFSLKISRRK